MRPVFAALAGAASLGSAFALFETLAFVATLALPLSGTGFGDAHAAGAPTAGLYRWKEADGSLTYSPTPPADGTPYEPVDARTLRPLAAPAATAPPVVPAASAPSAAADGTRTPGLRAAGAPRVRAAPVARAPLGTDATDGASPALGAAASPTRVAAAAAPAPGAPDERSRRCGELAKRVVSLERRLATPLSADEMDRTVVQMARYQDSAERHCR